MPGTLADGSSLSEYLKKARARQARGVFDETGAREAIERVRGREAEETGFQGQRVIGSNRGKFNPPKPPPERKASTPPAKKPDAPTQQVAQMPKGENHASPAKSTPKAMDAPKPEPKRDYAKENEDAGKARVSAAMKLIDEYGKEPAKPVIKADPPKWEAKWRYAAARRHLDERAATPGPLVATRVVGEGVTAGLKGVYGAAKGIAKLNRDVYKPLAKGAYRWVTGDPEAKKRLAAKS